MREPLDVSPNFHFAELMLDVLNLPAIGPSTPLFPPVKHPDSFFIVFSKALLILKGPYPKVCVPSIGPSEGVGLPSRMLSQQAINALLCQLPKPSYGVSLALTPSMWLRFPSFVFRIAAFSTSTLTAFN